MRRAALIYNPKSGRQASRRLLPEVLESLAHGAFAVDPRPTTGPGDATRLAREAAGAGCEVVFAMGGDGTQREAAAGLLGTEAALGVLPAGTANVLARAFGLPREARAAARMMGACRPREIDVGLAGGTPFLMMVSSGFDAAVMARQNARLKKHLGSAAVIWSAVKELWSYSHPEIELRYDGRSRRASFALVSNIAFYGGPFRLTPAADFRDRRLDLLTFRGRGGAATLAFTRDVIFGRHLRRPDVELAAVEEVRITGPSDLPAQVDGDVLPGALPLVVSLAPQRLRVLLP